MSKERRRMILPKVNRATAVALACVAAGALLAAALRCRPAFKAEYDLAYRPESKVLSGPWLWAATPAGIDYNLYIPEGLDAEDARPCMPMIVAFHGSTGKGTAKDRFGRIFTDTGVQKTLGENGAAVLVVQSRLEYFSDPHAYARLVRNVVMEHPCVDPARIAGYGFSQGAAFVQELAMYDPTLFRAVASGSSYYSASLPELFRAARVRFYCATARNDQGIYEQGHRTGRILSLICPDSRYVEYEKRGHFFIEPRDKTGRGGETFIDWLSKALRK